MRAYQHRRRKYQRRRLKKFEPVREFGTYLRQGSGAKLTKKLFELLEAAHSEVIRHLYHDIYTKLRGVKPSLFAPPQRSSDKNVVRFWFGSSGHELV